MQIYESNCIELSMMAQCCFSEVVSCSRLPDDLDSIAACIKDTAEICDLIVTSGGACGGDFDFMARAVKRVGKLIYDELDVHPAPRQGFGMVGSTPLFFLPGTPGASAFAFDLLIRPALMLMQGMHPNRRLRVQARLECDFTIKHRRSNYFGAILSERKGALYVTVPTQKDIIASSPARLCNCYAHFPGGPFDGKRGQLLECILMS
jgi:molybdopterin molybdotransferase